jgi:hypothetical protein
MDATKPLHAFFERIRSDQRISSTHIGIFAALLHFRMGRGFCNPLQAYSHEVMPLAKISALRTYCRCLKDLNEYGYLRYEPSKKKNRASRIYFLE